MSTCRYIMFYINSQCDYLSTSISLINRHQTHQCDYLSPFDINGKGPFSSWGCSPYPPERLFSYGASSCTSKTYKISIQKAFIFGVEITPSLWRRYSNASRGSGFVKMSATCSFVPTYSTRMFFSATCSCRK
jgi:hypothetical protein